MSADDRRIWKYELQPGIGIDMPEDAEVLHAAAQGDELCVWAICTPTKPPARRYFDVYGTGHPVPARPWPLRRHSAPPGTARAPRVRTGDPMSEILPHPVRSARGGGPRAWLFDRLVPGRALAWGRLTSPPPLELVITVDLSRFGRGMAATSKALDPLQHPAAVEFQRSWDEVRRIVEEPHDFGPAFERLAETMDGPGKVTADAFVPAQFDRRLLP